MKKVITFLFTFIIILTPMISVSANELETEQQQDIEYFPDGSYFVITLEQDTSNPLARSSTKSGSKTAIYYNASNTAMFYIKVSGTFTYAGSSATATSASGAVGYYVSGCSLGSKGSYTSGNSAIAYGTITYLGISSLSKTVTLSCSASGTLY